ncbi:MAG TPA: TolC family protein [Gammaproteobacteria bacterium]
MATTAAAAQAGAPAPTLPETVAAALARYPDLPLSDAIRTQGQALRTQASGLFAGDPSLMVRHESDAANDDAGYRQWETGVALPLWLPGQRDRRLRVADATERESEATRRLHAWQVAGQIRELLWSLQRAEAELVLAQRALQSAKNLEADVARRVQAGDLPRTDLILAHKETLAREIDLATAQSARDTGLAQYRHVTGLDSVPRDIRETAAAVSGISDDHPALRAARETAARAGADRDRVRAEKRANPVLTVGGKSERPEVGQDYASALIVEVNVPFGTRGQAAVNSATAERSYVEASAALTRAEQELEHDLHTAHAERELAARSLELAGQQQALSAQGLQLTQRAFELGEGDLFMLLQARAQELAAERDFELRRLERGRAVARFNQALGVIPE